MSEDRDPLGDRDQVAELLRLAGKRSPVPAERSARVKAAAHAAWCDGVRSRARRRRMWIAGALAAAACIAVVVGSRLAERDPLPPAPPIAHAVEAVIGPASARPDGAAVTVPLRVGQLVHSGAEIETVAGGRAALRLGSGHVLRLDAATRLRLLDPSTVQLDEGAVYVDSGFPAAASGALRVSTALGTIEEVGTQFEVRSGTESLRVRLREGTVVVHREGAADEAVSAGHGLTLHRDGTLSREAVPLHGEDWSWLGAITPMPDLDGRTARFFLEWVARERGWTLAFADAATEQAAATIVLGGTASGLSLEQALEAVLPASRLTWRLDGAVLVIGRTRAV